MKAIHNEFTTMASWEWDAFDSSKIQKWKQFTTLNVKHISYDKMLLIVQRYKNESNSQQPINDMLPYVRCFW